MKLDETRKNLELEIEVLIYKVEVHEKSITIL